MANTTQAMTPQARFRATLAHRQPDRPPIQIRTTHHTPPEVSLEAFRGYVRLLHKYCRKAGTAAA